jgi:hypothetical protein
MIIWPCFISGAAQYERNPGLRSGERHSPTVTHGRALVLYLLPQGAIEFTKS